jgi:hypothetical protein
MSPTPESEPPIEQAIEIAPQQNNQESNIPPEQHLDQIEKTIHHMEKSGVLNNANIAQEKIALESKFTNTMQELDKKIGEKNISPPSEKMIHEHTVTDVISFQQAEEQKYQELLKERDELTNEQTEKPEEPEEEEDYKPVKDPILQAALEASTVGDFSSKLSSARLKKENKKDEELITADNNMREIISGHGHYKVDVELPNINGKAPIGVTEMNESGGGQVTIDAEHLKEVATDKGKQNVHKTLKHEKVHTQQSRLEHDDAGTVIVDPKNNRRMTETEIHEGGAVHATKDMGGAPEDGEVYEEGREFYERRQDPSAINKFVEKDNEHAGDRVEMQAALAKESNINDKEKLEDLADKAGFSTTEKSNLLDRMGVAENDDAENELIK